MTYDTHTTRAALAHAIEEAIDLLDSLDGDSDFEPSLGSYQGGLDKYDLEGDAADDEPSLGSLPGIRQDGDRWSGAASAGLVCNTDAELDDCDAEDGGDREPNGDELDFSDHPSGVDGGIVDAEGLAEQSGVFDEADDGWRYIPFDQSQANRAAASEAAGRLRTIVARMGSVASHKGNLCPVVRP